MVFGPELAHGQLENVGCKSQLSESRVFTTPFFPCPCPCPLLLNSQEERSSKNDCSGKGKGRGRGKYHP